MTQGAKTGKDDQLALEVAEMLRIEHAAGLAMTVGRMVLGALVCLLVGMILASVLVAILAALLGGSILGWWGWYFVYLVALVPFLIWHERRTRPDYLADAMVSIDPKPSSRGEWEANQFSALVATVVSILVWGPRSLIDGVRTIQSWRTGHSAILRRAAAMVMKLRKTAGAVPLPSLLIVPEDMHLFGAAVDLLDEHGWIGRSSCGQSIWLDSRYREKVAARAAGDSK
jgi:hypothetical protein